MWDQSNETVRNSKIHVRDNAQSQNIADKMAPRGKQITIDIAKRF